jgi:hypothetical protein
MRHPKAAAKTSLLHSQILSSPELCISNDCSKVNQKNRLVPLNCLIKSAKCVCKSWAATIRSSHFAEAIERQGRSKPGLYVENHMSKSSSYLLDFKDDVNGQFEMTDLGTPQEMGYVISTCDGILLLWNCMQTFIVNPILKC